MSEPDHPENFGQLRQQVVSLERGHNELRKEFHVLDQKMDAGFAKIGEKLDAKSTPQWQAYTLIVTVLLTIGGLAYYPIRETSNKQDVLVENIRQTIVPRIEHEKLWREQIERERSLELRIQRQWDEAAKTARDLSFLQGQLHPLPK